MDFQNNIAELFPQEISKTLLSLSKTNNLEERKTHSEIIFNLCKSMGVFLEAMNMDDDFYDDDDEDVFPPLDFPIKISTKGKKPSKK